MVEIQKLKFANTCIMQQKRLQMLCSPGNDRKPHTIPRFLRMRKQKGAVVYPKMVYNLSTRIST